jgi:hypothetical protein
MSDHQPAPEWWQASDGRWYPPEQHPGRVGLPNQPYGYRVDGQGPTGTNGLAVASLVCSLIGVVTCGFPALLGIVFGHIGLHQTSTNPGQGGRGLAIGGLVVGYLAVLVLASPPTRHAPPSGWRTWG